MRPPHKTKDKVLVERSLAGDHSAYGVLVDRYGALVAGIARHYGVGRDVEDVVQEVFLRAWCDLPGLRKQDRFGAWVTQIARNEGRTRLRRRRVRRDHAPSAAQAGPASHPPTPEDEAADQQTAVLLNEALERIAPEYRLVLRLHYMEGCTYRQIARCLSLPLSTVHWRSLEAMRRLRRLVPTELSPSPVPSPPDRGRTVLGAIAVAAAVPSRSESVAIPPLTSLFTLAPDRGLLAGLALSLLIHIAVLKLGSPATTSPLPAVRYLRLPVASSRWHGEGRTSALSRPGLYRLPSPPIAPPDTMSLAHLHTPVPPITADPSLEPSGRLARERDLDILRNMARRSLETRHVPEELELLRLEDLDRSGSKHATIIVDSTDKRALRGFVHFPGSAQYGGVPALPSMNIMAELAEYMRFETDLEARVYAGNPWNHRRRNELLEYPILFSAFGVGPFADHDHWRPEHLMKPQVTADDREFLGRYLRGGGFLFIEGGHRYLETTVAHVRQALDGDGRLIRVPFDHGIYHSYYDFPGGFPGEYRVDYVDPLTRDPWYFPTAHGLSVQDVGLWGAEVNGEIVVLFSPQQILGLRPPPTQHDQLYSERVTTEVKSPWLRAATNIVVYALTRDGGLTHRRQPGIWAQLTRR